MPYIQNGVVHQGERSIFRLSIFSEVFWGIINFFYLFFQTLFFPNKTRGAGHEDDYRRRPGDDSSNGGGGGGGRGRPNNRIHGFRRNNAPGAPPMGGG